MALICMKVSNKEVWMELQALVKHPFSLFSSLHQLICSLLSVSTLSLIIPGEEEALSPNGGAKQCNGVSKTRILVADQGQDDDEKYE
ncbi:hypothetical protein SDJN03_05655, partial [Cucurbita argyrosperma subsp. sororia]